ncbi:MAG: class I SAM-dependent methyltransferase [Anaerolineae bacterium]
MPIRLDPEDTETAALFEFAGDFSGMRVLEVGCGDGRLTWRYAGRAAYVTAIDPDPDEIAAALEDLPPSLRDRIEFRSSSIADFDAPEAEFDIAILSWAL